MFLYTSVKVLKVIDGDTVKVEIDLGFNLKIEQTVRLYGINAPEIKGESREKGLAATEYLRSLIENSEITLETLKDKKEKYGRYLGKLVKDGIDINQEMVKTGHAIPYMETER